MKALISTEQDSLPLVLQSLLKLRHVSLKTHRG